MIAQEATQSLWVMLARLTTIVPSDYVSLTSYCLILTLSFLLGGDLVTFYEPLPLPQPATMSRLCYMQAFGLSESVSSC